MLSPWMSLSIASLIPHPVCRQGHCSAVATDQLWGTTRREQGVITHPHREVPRQTPAAAWSLPALHPPQAGQQTPSQFIPADTGCPLLQILFPDGGIAHGEAPGRRDCSGQHAGAVALVEGQENGGNGASRLPPTTGTLFFSPRFRCWRATLSHHSLLVPGTHGSKPCPT